MGSEKNIIHQENQKDSTEVKPPARFYRNCRQPFQTGS